MSTEIVKTGRKKYLEELELNAIPRALSPEEIGLYLCIAKNKLEELKSFKFASGNHIGDELVVEGIKFGENCELFTPFESHQPLDKCPFRFKGIEHQVSQEMEHQVGQETEHRQSYEEMEHQAGQETEHQHTSEEMEHQVDEETKRQHASEEIEHHDDQETEHQHAFEEIEHQVGQEIEQQVDSGRNALEATEEISKKGRNKTSFNISYEDLQQHLGKKIDNVIKELGVSRSTFKRIIRSHGIARWPSNAKNKKNPSIFEASNANKRVRGNRQETLVYSSNNTPCLDQNVLPNTDIIGSSQNHIELPKTDDAVIIKATFGDDTVKIQFCISSNMEKLVEEVVRRFNLTVGSFKLKYFDEDDEWTLLACDDDLKLCIKTLTSLGKKTPIKVAVQSI